MHHWEATRYMRGRRSGDAWGHAPLCSLIMQAFLFAAECTRTVYGSANAVGDAEETARVNAGALRGYCPLAQSGQQTESSGVSCTNRLLRPRIIKSGFHLLVRWSKMQLRFRSPQPSL